MVIKISKESILVTKRFFLTLETLREMKKMRGLKTFSSKYNLNYWNLSTLRKEPEKRVLKVEYLYYLVKDYGVNAHWLLTGEGSMFLKAKKKG